MVLCSRFSVGTTYSSWVSNSRLSRIKPSHACDSLHFLNTHIPYSSVTLNNRYAKFTHLRNHSVSVSVPLVLHFISMSLFTPTPIVRTRIRLRYLRDSLVSQVFPSRDYHSDHRGAEKPYADGVEVGWLVDRGPAEVADGLLEEEGGGCGHCGLRAHISRYSRAHSMR